MPPGTAGRAVLAPDYSCVGEMKRLGRAARASISFGSVAVRASRLPAGAGHLITDPRALHLIVVRQGFLVVSALGQEACAAGGEAVFVPSVPRCELHTTEACELVMISVPAELGREIQDKDILAGLSLIKDSALLMPMTAFASQTVRNSGAEVSTLGRYYIERLLQEMLLGLLTDSGHATRVSGAPDAYEQALSLLSAQYADPSLTSETVAEAVNLSKRQLERLFERRGTTIRKMLRQIRLEHARSLLQDSNYLVLSTEQIARYVGFSGASSLARALAAEGHASPSKLRWNNRGSAESFLAG